ncbi:MAG: SusE domain-containing protein [Paludibacter sp.]|nr:SusE domain-containing protein [Paludibacter sp.]
MKNLKIFISLLAGLLLAACADDAKLMITASPGAPVLSAPSMKTTAYNKDSAAYVLSMDSTGLAEIFKGTAANYGVNTTVTYNLQIDKAGNNFANAQTITNSTSDSLPVTVVQLYNLITSPTGLNATVGVKSSFDVRIMTTIGSTNNPSHPLYSNVQTIKINPLRSLKPYTLVTPNPWYIIGLADGKWSYSAAGIGVSMIPLSVVSGNAYSSAGDGTFTYTGYFQAANGFKIVSGKASDMGTWTNQWGSSDGKLTPVYMSGSSSNFTVPSDGYYTITLNSVSNTLTFATATAPTKSFASMGMIGEFNGWGTDVAMAASLKTNNHVWYATYTFTSDFTPPVGNGGMKFRANGAWTDNWGAGTFPAGIGSNGGTNIPFLKGTYIAVLNDIDGSYFFLKQ